MWTNGSHSDWYRRGHIWICCWYVLSDYRTLYGRFNLQFRLVFWGAAIVLFLLKWINVHNDNTQKFWIEISSQVVNGP